MIKEKKLSGCLKKNFWTLRQKCHYRIIFLENIFRFANIHEQKKTKEKNDHVKI